MAMLNPIQQGIQNGVRVYDPTGRFRPPPKPVRAPMPVKAGPGVSRLAGAASLSRASKQQQQEEEEDSNPFGRGLGFLVNNQVTQTLLKPLEIADYGRRAVTLAAEEFAEGITGQELKATEDDDRSNMEKLKDPTYGVGQLLGDLTGNKWADRAIGLVGDIAFDPLSYLTAGVGSVAGKGARASSLAKLAEAQAVAARSGDQAMVRALGGEEALERLGKRGLGVATPEQAAAMNLRRNGLRLSSPIGNARMQNPIPGTETLGRGINDLVGRARTPVRKLPGAKALRSTRNPTGFVGNPLGPALERVITGEGPGDIRGALATVAADDAMRELGGSFGVVASQTLEQTVKQLRDQGYDTEMMSELARKAEREGATNEWTELAAEMRRISEELFGETLPKLSGNDDYVMPHVLNRKFRNGLLDASKRGDASAQAFMQANGLRTQDLLEDSGFMQRRSIRPNEDGTPLELKLGDKTVTVERGTVDELNEKLADAFPWHQGDVYETNPIIAYQRYISGISRDVGKRAGGRRMTRSAAFGDLFTEKGRSPERFDPFGGTEQVFDADGNLVDRVVAQEGGFVENDIWGPQVDSDATAARNKEIRSTQKGVLDNLNIYSEVERGEIARELEAVADEVLAPMKQARSDASSRTNELRSTNQELTEFYNENQSQIADLAARQQELTSQIEMLAKVRYGIERTANQRTARRQAKYISDLDARRTELIDQRNRLETEFRGAREAATETDGSASSVRAARKQVNARVDDARSKMEAARSAARRKFEAANGEIPTRRQYEGAKRKVAEQPAAERGGVWVNGKFQAQPLTRDERVVQKYERWIKTEADATQAQRQRLNQALRDQDEFEMEAGRSRVAPPEVAPPAAAPEISPELRAKSDKAEKLLATPRARQLIADQNKLKALRQQAAKAKGKEKAALNKQARTLAASIEDRARLAKQISDARAAIRVSNEAQAKLDNKVAPRGTGIEPTPQPDLKRVNDTQQTIEESLAAADRGYLPRIAQTETELAATKNEQVGASLGNSEGMDAIALDEGMEAITKRQGVNDAQDQARFERTEVQREMAELDEMTGGMVEQYRENLQDIEASRLEHERIAADIRKGGATAFNPRQRADELADKKPTKAGLDRVAANEVPPAIEQPLYSIVEDIRRLIQANPNGDDELLSRIEAALTPLERRLSRLTTQADIPARQTKDILKAAKDGALAPVIRGVVKGTWREMWQGGDVLIDAELASIYKNLIRIDTEPSKFFRALTTYTNFFKTYATLTPGFHIRNAMSATFMNYAMGVPSATQIEGVKLWRRFTEAPNPREFLTSKDLTKRERDALFAVFSSGAGGRYFEAGVADATQLSTRMQERIFANRATKLSQKFGQDFIEGPVRASLALKTLDDGEDLTGAMQMIDRIQFDYSRVSEFDEKAKRLIPFWTFMSRNLPMQLTTMWTRPRAYARYNSFVRNFKGEEVEGTPEYFEGVGAFPFADTKIAGMPLFLQPDLAHTRLDEDMKNIEDMLSGENIARPLTNMNPIFTAPLEFATGRDLFTGRTYDETDLREAGVLEKPYELIASLLGQTKTTPGGKRVVSEKFLDAMRSINPLYDRAVRLAPQATTGGNNEDAVARQLESFARVMGAPTRTLSPQQQQSALRAQNFDRRDEMAMAKALAAFDR